MVAERTSLSLATRPPRGWLGSCSQKCSPAILGDSDELQAFGQRRFGLFLNLAYPPARLRDLGAFGQSRQKPISGGGCQPAPAPQIDHPPARTYRAARPRKNQSTHPRQ